MNTLKENLGAFVMISCAVFVGTLYLAVRTGPQPALFFGGNSDTNFVNTNFTFGTTVVSSTRQKVCSANSARRELVLGNLSVSATNTVQMYFTNASTSVISTSGIPLAPSVNGGSGYFIPPFAWPGEVWAISNQGVEARVTCTEN